MVDRDHLDLFWDGDEAVFSDLFRTHTPALLRYAMSFAQDEDGAHDMVQHAWFQIYRSRRRFLGQSSLKTWIFAVARNAFLSDKRTRDRLNRVIRSWQELSAPRDDPNPADRIDEHERSRRLRTAMTTLSARQYQVLMLRLDHGLSTNEIAHELSLAPSTVRVHLAQGVARLRATIGDGEG